MTLTRRTFLAAAPAVALTAGSLPPVTKARADAPAAAPGNILIVVANEIAHPTMGFPLGFWAAELTHPYAELVAHGHPITIASLQGGKVTVDAYSDPRHESGYSAQDFVSLGFLTSPKHAPLLDATAALADIKPEDHAAIIVAGGQAPMFTFRENTALQGLIRAFYDARKPTAALCHGVSALVDVKLDDGSYLIAGKTVTGFSAAEDAYVDEVLGAKLFNWWVEPAMRERGANYTDRGMWANYAVADGNLITGQQQNSGGSVARLILEQLES
ncbi:MAG: type 1 glutamine amidotransferase domain-containing protein [Tabrizicola sp.]